MYKNIVVGYDGSEFSKAAFKEAALWVKKHGGKVYLVHAVYFDSEEFAILPSQLEKRFELSGKVCLEAKKAIQEEVGLEAESFVCEGEPPEVLIDIVRGKNADLIALGTYGKRGIKRLLMGSVTTQVILDAPCDVLVVKRPCSKCTGSYASILLPFDGSETSKKAMARAIEMSKTDGSQITVLYVIPRYEEMVEFFRTDSIKNSLRKEAEKVIKEAEKAAKDHGVAVKTEIREGHVADEIIRASETLMSDLIIMGTYGWRGVNKALIGSTSNHVVTLAACPILVVK